MGYIGKVPADVLIDPHVDSAAITDGTIITADIANDAVTSAKLAQNSVDSSELIDGSVDNSHLAGSIAINKTLLTAGTGLTLSTNTLSVDAAQSQITSVGTLTSLTTSGTITSTTSSTTDSVLTLGDAGVADYKFTFPNTSTIRLSTNTSSDKTLDITNAGSGVFALNVEGTVTVGASNGSTEVKVNRSRMRHIDGLADASDYSHGDLYVNHISTGNIYMQRDTTFAGNASIQNTAKFFQVISHTDTSKITKHGYDGLYTSGSQHQYIQSGQAIKFYPNASLNMQMSAGGSFQVGAGAIGTTNADNWKIVSKTTAGGTIDSTDGAGYFALGDNYTTSGGILMVRNDGNRGSRRHASGSSLFKASFNDATAFEIKKDGEIHGGYGCPVGFTGNWEVIDVISCGSAVGSLSSNNCFNDQTYSHFKIIIPHYRPTDNATDILLSFLYNTGSGLNEQVGDYYGHKQSMAHTNSGYLGGTYTNANRMTIFTGASNSTHAPTHGEITVFNVNTGDTRNFDTGKFTAHDYAGDGDTGSTYRPIGYFDMVGYNDTSDYYSRDTGMFRVNTSRHASYWKGFRIQQSTGNISANTKIIVLGMKL